MRGDRRVFWNPAGIAFAVLFLALAALFGVVAATAAGWLGPAVDDAGAARPSFGFGPLGAGVLCAAFLVLAARCNLWVVVLRDAVRVRGAFVSRRLSRDGSLRAEHDFRTRPTALRLTSGRASVVVYPRPRGSETLIEVLRSG